MEINFIKRNSIFLYINRVYVLVYVEENNYFINEFVNL